jgi:hypothetical protein
MSDKQLLRLRRAGGGCAGLVANNQTWLAFDHEYKGFRRYAGGGVRHAKSVLTRLPKLDIGRELARLVGLRG